MLGAHIKATTVGKTFIVVLIMMMSSCSYILNFAEAKISLDTQVNFFSQPPNEEALIGAFGPRIWQFSSVF